MNGLSLQGFKFPFEDDVLRYESQTLQGLDGSEVFRLRLLLLCKQQVKCSLIHKQLCLPLASIV